MFEVGKNYKFRMLENGCEIVFQGTIETYEHPLIKLADSLPVKVQFSDNSGDVTEVPPYPGEIINVTSPNFISAKRHK